MKLLLILSGCISIFGGITSQTQFRVIKEWKYVNFTWRNEEDLRNGMATGMYYPEKCIMSGLGYYKGYYYITTPRMYDGTPATLSRIPAEGKTAPPLDPFPSWKKNRLGDCNALQNVQNVQIDADGMLYAIDLGRINTLAHQSTNLCAPKIVKYDLKISDGEDMAKEVYKYEFPSNVASSQVNYLYDLVLDDHYIYISDNSAQNPGLIVFSELEMKSWKIQHGTFKADVNATKLNMSGIDLDCQLNLAGLALGPQGSQGGRQLYYTPMSSFHLFAVNTEELKNPHATTLKNVQLVGRKSSQTDGMTMDNDGVLYYGQIGSSSIVRWDTTMPYRPKLIARDPTYVQWPSSFTFNDDGELVVLGNTLAKFLKHRVDLNEPNFRLLAGNVSAHSYVLNRFKYDEDADHVHFHMVTPSSGPSSSGKYEINDLLIHNDIDENVTAKKNSAFYLTNNPYINLMVRFVALLFFAA